jgi:carbamate kinase
MNEKIVVALGGNALIREHQIGTIEEQFANMNASLAGIVHLIKRDHALVITHGNGPQVGNILIRTEAARGQAYDLPLDICVAQSQGEIGYLIQQCLQNALYPHRPHRTVITLISQTVVSQDELKRQEPTKPIGPFYTEAQAEMLRAQGHDMIEDAGRGYRRVVRSPAPRRIIEQRIIRDLILQGVIVIAVGGGGIPVTVDADSCLRGVAAVVDKDLATAVLAIEIEADKIIELTPVEKVKLNFGTQEEKDIDRMTVSEARRYLAEAHFPPGSMGPKIEAAILFLENGGREVIITQPETLMAAFDDRTGTHIFPD